MTAIRYLMDLLLPFPSRRLTNILAFLACVGLVVTANIFEQPPEMVRSLLLNVISPETFDLYFHEDPCPLCLFQRYFVILVGLFYLLAFLLNIIGKSRIGNGVMIVLSLAVSVFGVVAFEWLGNEPVGLPHFLRYLLVLAAICYFALFVLNLLFSDKVLARTVGTFIFIAAVMGAATSVRHIWIQMLPDDQVPECAPPLDFMVQMQGFMEAINRTFLTGTGDCHDSNWIFLGLTMPMWVLVWFIGLGVVGLVRNWIVRRPLQ